MTNIFSADELITFNEMMLGRGMPITQDGKGYNKADFGACSTYFNGLSNAQLMDLSKRLVKYCDTQLNVDRQKMKNTSERYKQLTNGKRSSDGVSIEIREHDTKIYFKYNPLFIETIKKQPRRKWDNELKKWIVPNEYLIQTLSSLGNAGADVENAIRYAKFQIVS